MVAYWRFEEGNGSVATDSVNGHDGTIYEAARTTGQVGGALHFDGTNDRVEVPSDPAFMPQGKFTTEAWIYPESTISEQEIFSALLPAYYQVLIINNEVALNYYYNLGGGYYIVGAGMPALNAWHHIVATYEESGASATSRIYIDGAEKAEFTGEPIVKNPRQGPVYIGANHDWASGQREFIGSIDEVAVYNRALTAEEIQQHYKNGLAGLGYWDEKRLYRSTLLILPFRQMVKRN